MQQLPDDAIGPSGMPPDEVEANFDRAFHEMYGIHVDELLALRGGGLDNDEPGARWQNC